MIYTTKEWKEYKKERKWIESREGKGSAISFNDWIKRNGKTTEITNRKRSGTA